MGLESSSSRCEQIARQMQIYGRPIPPEESVAKIMAVTTEDIVAAARRLFRARPTLAAIGPLGQLAPLDRIAEGLSA